MSSDEQSLEGRRRRLPVSGSDRLFAFAALAAVLFGINSLAAADPIAEQIWLISTRPLGCDCVHATAWRNVDVQFYDRAACKWHRLSLESFLATDSDDVPTVVWVHGNHVDPPLAKSRGLAMYRALVGKCAGGQPVRYVIWSWPSSRIRGPLRDVREKYYRTGPEGYRMAQVLGQIKPEVPLRLIGFSYGTRIISSGLHLMGGGTWNGKPLDPPAAPRAYPSRAVMMTAGQDKYSLLPGEQFGQALSQVDDLLLLNNSCDRAMKRFRFVDPCTRPEALGYWGMSCGRLSKTDRAKVTQRDVCCQVGRVHSVCPYLDQPALMQQAWLHLTAERAAAE